MNEKIISHTLYLTRASRIQHFQLPLPRDAETISSVQTGISQLLNALPIGGDPPLNEMVRSRQPLIGELRLQLNSGSNWFYAEQLTEQDENITVADFSRLEFAVNTYSHGTKSFPTPLGIVLESGVISGAYRDKIGDWFNDAFAYRVSIYVRYLCKKNNS